MPTNRFVQLRSSNASRAFAITGIDSYSSKFQTRLITTINGSQWRTISLPLNATTQEIRDIADNGATLTVVGTGGLVLQSPDQGLSWVPVTVPGLVKGTAVAWFGGKWVIVGTDATGVRAFLSSGSDAWETIMDCGIPTLPFEFLTKFSAHGRLYFFQRNRLPVTTTDARSWQRIQYPTTGSDQCDYAATIGGIIAIASGAADAYTAPPDGSVWTKVPALQTGVTGIDSVDGRLFLMSTSQMKEWSSIDLALDLLPATSAQLGVGDTLRVPISVTNLGLTTPTENLSVDAWLSPDGFRGDGNDVYLGRMPLSTGLPPAGGTVSADLAFTLPDSIHPGNLRVIVGLDQEGELLEQNSSNNIGVSAEPLVTIPQHRLNLASNGSGSISANQVAEYYPHKARISFMARPGKGARFAGWGGDAVGTLSETLLIMDSDKSVVANFVATSALTAFSRGAGAVVLDASDGLYETGTTAALRAVPAEGWTFAGWSGALGGANPEATLLMNEPKSVTATFRQSFADWAARAFAVPELANPLISGSDADPDADGLVNWREWLHASNPKDDSSTGRSVMRREARWMVMTYTRLAVMPEGYDARCVASSDLRNWSIPIQERVLDSAGGIDTIEVRVDTTGRPALFLSVADTRPAVAAPSTAWSEAVFPSISEQSQPLISSKAADPDGDAHSNWRE
jgi:hypothetical protein